ncbi:MAG TPA: SUF system Fe-S cluster assembly protein [Tepidisphaeraceae bacterium]
MNDEYRYPHSRLSLPVLPNGAAASEVAAPVDAAAEATAPRPDETAPTASNDPTRFVEQKLIEGKVIEALRQVYDPEIPIDIYELGLIYDIKVEPDHSVKIKMTLTAPACPVAGSLPGEVERKVESIPEVKNADVELVWDPPWSRDRMSEAALLQLGML